MNALIVSAEQKEVDGEEREDAREVGVISTARIHNLWKKPLVPGADRPPIEDGAGKVFRTSSDLADNGIRILRG